MLYLYDQAIQKDIASVIAVESGLNDIVKVIDKAGVVQLVAQMKEDQIKFPIICLTRHPDTPIDTQRSNFTRIHKGVAACYDPVTHNIYYEKAIPIRLEYDMTVLATNTADRDELVREIMFRYTNTYFIDMDLPYEADRKMRFGVVISGDVTSDSGSFEYLSTGALYQAIIPLRCEGAVLLHYTPKHIERTVIEPKIVVNDSVEIGPDGEKPL